MAIFKRSATTPKGFDWAGLCWLFLFFWYFSGITQLLIQVTGTSGFAGFRQAFVMSGIWLAPMLLFPAKTRVMAAVIGVVLWACSMASLGYFFIYQQEFSQSVIFIMFESNISEAGEYATRENAIALTHIQDAMMWLQKRTRDRIARGVEGTNQK